MTYWLKNNAAAVFGVISNKFGQSGRRQHVQSVQRSAGQGRKLTAIVRKEADGHSLCAHAVGKNLERVGVEENCEGGSEG